MISYEVKVYESDGCWYDEGFFDILDEAINWAKYHQTIGYRCKIYSVQRTEIEWGA